MTEAPATPWAEGRRRLAESESYWLATVSPPGRPHVVAVLGVWFDGRLWFCTRERSRKGRNLAGAPGCVLSVDSREQPALDLVVHAEAARVTDGSTLNEVADGYAAKYGWPVEVRDGALWGDGAPTAGPPPYAVFAATPTTVFAVPGVHGGDDEGQAAGRFGPTR
ncbi:pyridoxamine 5'-phosphate oxidase family protein [soil metagenome]